MRAGEKISFIGKIGALFSRKERRHFFIIMFSVFVMSVFQALGVASIFPFIRMILDPEIIFESRHLLRLYDYFNFEDTRSFTIAAGFAMAGIIIFGNLASAFTVWLKTRFIWKKSHKLSSEILRNYLSMPYVFFVTQNSAKTGRNILMEVQTLAKNFMIPFIEVITDTMVAVLIFAALILISPAAAVVIFLLFCVFYGLLFQLGLRERLKAKGAERLKENERRFKSVSESFEGIKDIKILGREKYFLEKFEDSSLKFSSMISWHEVAQQVPKYFIEIIAFGGAVIFVLFLMIRGHEMREIIPLVSFFAFAGYRLLPLMNRMFQFLTRLQFNTAVLNDIYNDVKRGGGSRGAFSARENRKLEFADLINFENVSFSYPGSKKYVLKEINLGIKKNTSAAFAGATGAGKTTLADILMGLLLPTEGCLKVDGAAVDESKMMLWRNQVGYVPQNIYLSDDSVRRNIAFGVPEEMVDELKIQRAAKIANLHDFVERDLPEGYNTLVGERGIRLSGGQRQRIGIARALYNDPELLVFDEATSSLDAATEEAVLKAIEGVSRMKTIVIIAHRLTTVQNCDIIYMLEGGKISGSGSYGELIRNNAGFRAMAGSLKKSRAGRTIP